MTERQNDSMTIWQNSRAAKEPALVINESPCPLHAQKDSATDSDRFYVFLIFEVEAINVIFTYFT